MQITRPPPTPEADTPPNPLVSNHPSHLRHLCEDECRYCPPSEQNQDELPLGIQALSLQDVLGCPQQPSDIARAWPQMAGLRGLKAPQEDSWVGGPQGSHTAPKAQGGLTSNLSLFPARAAKESQPPSLACLWPFWLSVFLRCFSRDAPAPGRGRVPQELGLWQGVLRHEEEICCQLILHAGHQPLGALRQGIDSFILRISYDAGCSHSARKRGSFFLAQHPPGKAETPLCEGRQSGGRVLPHPGSHPAPQENRHRSVP